MKKLKKINKNVMIIVTIILVIIVITALVFIFTHKNKKQEDNQNNNIETNYPELKTEIDMTDTENCKIREDGMKINTSPKIAQGIEFNDVKIENIKIESSGDMATFNATVTNPYEKDLKGYIIYITFLAKDGTEIATVETLFPQISAGATGYISATTPKDIATAYDIKIERERK